MKDEMEIRADLAGFTGFNILSICVETDMRSVCKTFYPGQALRTTTHFRDILRNGKRARRIARIVSGTGSKSELRGDIWECSRAYEFEGKGD